jgi:signal transduction histidine kinase
MGGSAMLHDFLIAHRDEILARTHGAAAIPPPGGRSPDGDGLAELLAELARALQTPARLSAGYTVADVVLDYAAVRRAVIDLAGEKKPPLSPGGTRALERSFDEAVAHAVAEHSARQARTECDRRVERMGFFAHEMSNLVTSAALAFDALRSAKVGVSGSTGALLERNLARLRHLADRSRAEVRLDAGLHHRELVPLSELVEEAGVAAALEANARGFQLTVSPVEPGVVVETDRHLLAAALANLLQNAFKFSRSHGHVILSTDTTRPDDRVLIEVEDECGGLAPEVAEALFRPFQQRSGNRSGLGLGLAIARESVETSGGTIRARSVPDQGCVFTIELPRFLVGAKAWSPAEESTA